MVHPKSFPHRKEDATIRALLYDSGDEGLWIALSLGGIPGEGIDESIRSLLVEPDHPAPQRLTIIAANLCRLYR